MAGISSDIIRGYNDTMILYLLLDKPSYGYEISKQIKALSNEKYIMKETTLYSAFTRMEKNGYITSFPGVGDNGGKKRTYYSITDAGREYYKARCEEWALTKEVVEQLLRRRINLWKQSKVILKLCSPICRTLLKFFVPSRNYGE